MKLKDTTLKNAKPREKAYKLFDGGGLYLEVTPAGGKYWRLKYRFGGKESRLAFGVYPEVSLAAAREKRNETRELLRRTGFISLRLTLKLLIIKHHFDDFGLMKPVLIILERRTGLAATTSELVL
jgi:hypothetical protein